MQNMFSRFLYRRAWLVVLVLVIGAGALFFFFRQRESPQIETVRIEPQTVTVEVTATGRVEAQETVDLGFERGGKVIAVPVDVGERVTHGQLLATVDARQASIDFADATAALNATQTKNLAHLEKLRQDVRDKKLELDQTESVRQKEIAESGDDSVKARNALLVVRKAETAYRAAQKALTEARREAEGTERSARTAVESARVVLTDTALRAPFAGTVTAVEVRVGEVAPAGTTVVTMQSFGPPDIVFDIPESDAVKLKVGQTGSVTFDAYGEDLRFTVTLVDLAPAATLVEGVPTFRATFALETDDERLKSGMTATITVRAAERRDVLAVPQRALTRRDGRTFVRVLQENQQIEEREVSLGLTGSDGMVEIVRGLTQGEQVVVRAAENAGGRGGLFR